MPRKKSYLTVTDQFCGAGGSSQGAVAAGLEVTMAMNHWPLAIETHNKNFPKTDHDCADMSAVDPRRYPSTDILITSPECTNHSQAKGVKPQPKQFGLWQEGKIDPAAERSRATMWDVCRFAEHHKYRAIIVENVVDARKWVLFDTWIAAMRALGYEHRCCYLNSMHFHPCPQSRDRMYVVFWQKRQPAPKLDYTPTAYCPRCGKDVAAMQTWKRPDVKFGKYRQQYVYCCPSDGMIVEPYYYASFNCIDWTNQGTRIGDRPKELSPNTRRRIEHGLKKYGCQPLQVANYSPGYTRPIIGATPTIKTKDSTGLFQPVPFIIKQENTHNTDNTRAVNESVLTQATRQSMMLIRPPFMVENKGKSKAKAITEAAGCVTTVQYLGIVTPDAWNAFTTAYYGGSICDKHFSDELGTVPTKDRLALVSYLVPAIDDCFYRMLTPMEIKLAMAFGPEYIVLGSGKEQVKQLGNAVTPPVMEWLIGQAIKSLR